MTVNDSNLSTADAMHLLAAEGWLELGDWESALEELEEVEPKSATHPDVLRLSVEACVAGELWDEVIEVAGTLAHELPKDSIGHVHLAAALHTLGRTKEAWTTLLRVSDRFPDQWIIPYNLARYAAQLGDLVTARDLLAQAFKLGDAKALKLQSMDDPDLAPLWVTLR